MTYIFFFHLGSRKYEILYKVCSIARKKFAVSTAKVNLAQRMNAGGDDTNPDGIRYLRRKKTRIQIKPNFDLMKLTLNFLFSYKSQNNEYSNTPLKL